MLSLRFYIRLVLLYIGAAYFVFAGAVQYNDPDPLHWMLLYFMSAVMCVLHALGRAPTALLYLTAGMAAAEMATTAGGLLDWLRLGNENVLTAQMSAAKPYIELTREFFGAAISLIVMLLIVSQVSRRPQSKPEDTEG
ncbi:transmembrane 220 family protein [Turneriella parva]|uniref:Transmembrane protein n=1 Tax=Turneriella parva (strain ATCC BAA-1111 / DSM 21527 / NCTC 11395 / H) TaxID=869212 RepID=I4B849_TURPD|nr:transmembrane 220 family protein [Turneriella parva]AFM13456.1 hypothetical protein Turpa_2817 [Turneriella parva DSM 21527]